MSPALKKNLIATLIILAGFFLVTVLFNYPATIGGKVLATHDYVQWRSVAYEAMQWKDKTGEQPLWSNSVFGGMPTYTFYGPMGNNYILYIGNFFYGILPRPANYMLLAMICFFILTSVLKINRWLGAIGAIAFAFSSYNILILHAGHETKMMDISYIPAVFAGMVLLFRGKYLTGGALFSVALSLAIVAGHYQIVYYLILILAFTGIGMLVHAYRKGTLKTALIGAGIAVVLAGIAAGTASTPVMLTSEYSKETQRGGKSELNHHDQGKSSGGLDKSYAFRWSNGIGETFCVLVPYLYGGGSMEDAKKLPRTNEATGEQQAKLPSYWGPQATLGIEGPVYFGAVVCFLFVLGMMLVRNPVKWWALAVSILAFLMAMGDSLPGFNYFLFDNMPGLNKFRNPAMILVIPEFIFPLFGIWGLHEVMRGRVSKEELWKKAKIAAIATGGLALVLGLLGGMFFDYTNKVADAQIPQQLIGVLKEDRQAMARNSALMSAFFIAATAALVWLYSKQKIKTQWLIAGVGLLIAVDLIPFAGNYLGDDSSDPTSVYKDKEEFDGLFQPKGADRQIQADKDAYYRVLDVSPGIFSDARFAIQHKGFGGYSAAKLENYQDIMDVHLSKGFNSEIINMFNAKYFMVSGGGPGQEGVIPNPNARGNAWFVSNIRWTKTAEEDINALNAPLLGDTAQAVPGAFNAKEIAVIRDRLKDQLQGFTPSPDSGAAIKLTKYGLNDLTYQSTSAKEGLGVFSEVYYDKGWKAFIDGKEVPIIRADYVLRALRIPAGSHKIEFRFAPATYEKGKMISLICSLIIIALIAVAGFSLVKNSKDTPAAA